MVKTRRRNYTNVTFGEDEYRDISDESDESAGSEAGESQEDPGGPAKGEPLIG